MLFNSLHFVVFYAVVLSAYWALGHRGQNRLLLIASYYFYGSWDWRFLTLIWLTTLVDYKVGHLLADARDARRRRATLAVSVVLNLGLLGTFKYFDFFAGSLHDLLAALGFSVDMWTLHVILPVGISFYTFQSMSYTIDVYRGRAAACRSLADFAAYVCFYPQLVAGPIERPAHLLTQIQQPRRFAIDDLWEGMFRICWGMWKKMVVADNMAPLVKELFASGEPGLARTLLAGTAFAFQIYCDFSAYSDIAIGTARTMGFGLMENFSLPYFSTCITEFWRRWHISLSTWLRDYLYISLGGNRRGPRRTYVNLMATMLLGGLWHGAAWTFVLWGGLQGLMLAVERASGVGPVTWAAGRLRFVLRVALTFQLVCLSWLLFRAQGLEQLGGLLAGYAHPAAPTAHQWLLAAHIAALALPLLVLEVFQQRAGGNPSWLLGIDWRARAGLYVVYTYALMLFGKFGGYDFIYFQF